MKMASFEEEKIKKIQNFYRRKRKQREEAEQRRKMKEEKKVVKIQAHFRGHQIRKQITDDRRLDRALKLQKQILSP